MARLIWFYRPWWLVLDGVRLLIRATVGARRNSFIWPVAMTIRWLVHVVAAVPWLAGLVVALVLIDLSQTVLAWGLVVCAVAESAAQVARFVRHPAAETFWTYRRSRGLHRRWPRAWGDYAGRTNQVQAATGSEPSTPVRWRPMVDHPRLSWLYLPAGPGAVEFLVAPPPDRTYTDLVKAAAALAAKFSYVESIEVDYPSDRSSLAVLTVTFTRRRRPVETPTPHLRLVDNHDDGGSLPAAGEARSR